MKRLSVVCASLVALFGFAASASAVDIVGDFSISGGTIAVSGQPGNEYAISFNGVATTIPAPTGYFASLGVGSAVTNTAFTNRPGNPTIVAPPPAGTQTYTTIPTGTLVNIPNFLNNFVGNPGLQFDLTLLADPQNLGVGVCTGAPSIGCVAAAGSPFVLSSTLTGVSAQFGVLGTFIDSSPVAATGAGRGLYTTQFTSFNFGSNCFVSTFCSGAPGSPYVAGTTPTIAQLLQILGQNGSVFANSFSATFTSVPIPTVPEPATLLTFGVAASVLAARRRRQLRRQAK